jgi:hypothetical protein
VHLLVLEYRSTPVLGSQTRLFVRAVYSGRKIKKIVWNKIHFIPQLPKGEVILFDLGFVGVQLIVVSLSFVGCPCISRSQLAL